MFGRSLQLQSIRLFKSKKCCFLQLLDTRPNQALIFLATFIIKRIIGTLVGPIMLNGKKI